MNSGEEDTSPILRASRVQSSSFMLPLRRWLSGIFASAESSRMVISLRVISREKITLAMLWWIDAARQKSRPSVDFPIAGRAAMITIWPGCRPLVSSSRSAKPVGTPIMSPSRLLIASISSSADSMISLSGA